MNDEAPPGALPGGASIIIPTTRQSQMYTVTQLPPQVIWHVSPQLAMHAEMLHSVAPHVA